MSGVSDGGAGVGGTMERREDRVLGPWFARWTACLGILLLGAIALLAHPALALATSWYPVAEASQGQQQQFIDLDSIEPTGWAQVRVSSYYIDSRSGTPQRTHYLTEYDCRRRRFRDVEFHGSVGSHRWMPVDPDPLNSAAMEYACAMAKLAPGSIPQGSRG